MIQIEHSSRLTRLEAQMKKKRSQPIRAFRRSQHRHSEKAGLPPGSLVFLGNQRVETVEISAIDYTADTVREKSLPDIESCASYIKEDTTTWINITGLHDTEILGGLGTLLNIHPLVIEDVLNTGQRPKFEDHGAFIFCVVRMLYRGNDNNEVVSEQVSMILGPNTLITFQEMEGDVFDIIRDRIRAGKGRIRSAGCDYLAYSLLDAIVDNYFIVLEDVGDKIETLQETVLEHPEPATLQAIHKLKREMIFMRKNLWPLREMVSGLEKSESDLIGRDLSPYLHDLYEHTFQVIDTVETWRDMLSGALDIYMSSVSNRMNEVMKVLTVIATIFIPLTFVAGVYGMNFEHMPELKYPMAYPAVWAVMICMGLGMALFFKRKKWW